MPGVDVALGDGRERGVVAVATIMPPAVVGPVGVHQRRVGRERRFDVVDDGQRLVLDDDCVDCALGGGSVDGGHGGDDLALEAHHVVGEQRAVLHERAEPHVGHVGLREHGEHAGHRLRARRHVEPGDAGVGHVGVLELRGQRAGECEVGRVAAAAGHLVGAVGADEARRCGVVGDGHR